jgi:outer membrane murein-binding lipoprotein Lpp
MEGMKIHEIVGSSQGRRTPVNSTIVTILAATLVISFGVSNEYAINKKILPTAKINRASGEPKSLNAKSINIAHDPATRSGGNPTRSEKNPIPKLSPYRLSHYP